ncbi:transposase, partial [Gluconobacter sp. P1D12_c]|uniref:transposase n=1 Tax=Gluconobacter sp. P1D12_c TaxID=2762614 RepID=UPI0035ABDFE3
EYLINDRLSFMRFLGLGLSDRVPDAKTVGLVTERLTRLSGLGDELEAFSRTVDFEVFRPDLEKALAYSDGSKGGRPPFDSVLMFRILVIQTLNNLSDKRTEYLINDRLSFMRFLVH